MIDLGTMSKIALKWGDANWPRVRMCPPEAKFITGDPVGDAQFHYFEEDSGVALKISDDHTRIVGYDVLDEQKFTMFLLRWL